MTNILSDKEWAKLPKAAREHFSFLYLIQDATLENLADPKVNTGIRCFKKECQGLITTRYDDQKDILHWQCDTCPVGGSIVGWMYGSKTQGGNL